MSKDPSARDERALRRANTVPAEGGERVDPDAFPPPGARREDERNGDRDGKRDGDAPSAEGLDLKRKFDEAIEAVPPTSDPPPPSTPRSPADSLGRTPLPPD